jgi:restriction system protein
MRKDLNIIDFLAQVPWWLYVTLSAICYITLQYVIPHFQTQGVIANEVHVSLGPLLAPVVAVALLSPVTFSFLKSNRRQKLHELRKEIKSIQDLSWPQFKELTAEAYRQTGYLILDSGPYTEDRDIDLVMRKSANLFLLQARYWRNRKIGLREVKKLFSLMHEKQASGVYLLTTGVFTREARRYAVGRPITLVNGIQLVELLAGLNFNNPQQCLTH